MSASTQKPKMPASETLEIFTVPITDVKPADDNIRRSVGDVTELAASITAVGILEPLIVVELAEARGYRVVAGHRRLAAAREAGLDYVPVIVRTFDERARIEAMLVENLMRADLSPLEEATGYQRLVDVGLAQREIAERVGCSQSHVAKRLGLLGLPTEAQKVLDSGGITLEDAAALLELKEHPDRIREIVKAGRPVEYAVRNSLRDIKIQEGTAKVRAELVAASVQILETPKNWPWSSKERPLGRSHHRGLDITPAKHRKEPCHAAIVVDDYDKLSPVYVCVDPSRHAAKGASAIKVKDATRERRQDDGTADRKAKLKAGRKARAAFVPELIQSRIAREDIIAFGARQLLNLGHTVGHAIETVTGYRRYRHGEAVALGLLAALRLSGAPALRAQVAGLLAAAGLPTTLEDADPEAVVAATRRDKKRVGGRVPFVLVRAPGDVVFGERVEEADVLAAVRELAAG